MGHFLDTDTLAQVNAAHVQPWLVTLIITGHISTSEADMLWQRMGTMYIHTRTPSNLLYDIESILGRKLTQVATAPILAHMK